MPARLRVLPPVLSGPLLFWAPSALPCFSIPPPPQPAPSVSHPYRTGLLSPPVGLRITPPAAHFQRAIIPLLTHRFCTTAAGGPGPAWAWPARRISLPASLRPLTEAAAAAPPARMHFIPPNCIRPAILIARRARAAGAWEASALPARRWAALRRAPPLHASPMTRLSPPRVPCVVFPCLCLSSVIWLVSRASRPAAPYPR